MQSGCTDVVEVSLATNSNGLPLTARGLKTRNALIVAARVIFERDGFTNARITDISEKAGVAHGTFYTYFESKEEIFRAVIIALQEALNGDRAGKVADLSGASTAYEAALRANRRYLATWQDHTKLMQLWEQVAVLDTEVAAMLRESRMVFVDRVEAAILSLQDAEQIDPELNPRIAAFALTGMVSRFAYVWFMQGEEFDFDEVTEQLTRMWMNALGADLDVPR